MDTMEDVKLDVGIKDESQTISALDSLRLYQQKKQHITHSDNEAVLPSLLYTNCRSVNEWKLAELAVLVEINQPQIICLTETWLTAEKEQSRQ